MVNLKNFLAKYVLYVYNNFILDEDIYIYKKKFSIVIKILTFLHSVYVWIASILFFPFFLIAMKIEDINKNN